jgi:predicted signal transduction protein with EAL and GGDEF domain
VETELQLERMRSFGINAIQGYLFSKPLPVHQLRRVIAEPIFPVLSQPKRVTSLVEMERSRRAAS